MLENDFYCKADLQEVLNMSKKYHNGIGKIRFNTKAVKYDNNKEQDLTLTCYNPTVISPGTKLIKEFKGKKYEVLAVEDGYLFQNKIYKSLSAIANEITGSHWNGKKFFGIT